MDHQQDFHVVAVPGFALTGAVFDPLRAALATEGVGLTAATLPRLGAQDPSAKQSIIAAACAHVHGVAEALPDAPPILWLGHSMGAHIATLCANAWAGTSVALVSLEGNLHPEDGALSNRADQHAAQAAFHADICATLSAVPKHGPVLRAQAEKAAPSMLWHLAKELMDIGRQNAFLTAFNAPGPPRHYWLAKPNRSAATVAYLHRAPFSVRYLDGTSHWPMLDAPGQLARMLIDTVRSRS